MRRELAADGPYLMPAPTSHPAGIRVEPALEGRNRLTTAFRLILAIPHLVLVGGPLAVALAWGANGNGEQNPNAGAGGGLLGAVAAICAIIAWFAIVFTGRHPQGLWNLAAFYLRWRVRAAAYTRCFATSIHRLETAHIRPRSK